jgi:hypothetical protein
MNDDDIAKLILISRSRMERGSRREIKILKPIDKVSLGETTSCRAVTTANVNVASKSVDPRVTRYGSPTSNQEAVA